MKATTLIKKAIVDVVRRWEKKDNVAYELAEAEYEKLKEADEHWDAEDEIRCSGHVTNISPPGSRNYEPVSHARLVLGTWVGWTHWTGGGKHSNPSEIEWVEDAYLLDCEEKVITVVERTFTKTK